MTVNLLDFDAEGLTAWFAEQGEKPFRAKQVLRWIHRAGVADFDAMTDIAKSLREKLKAKAVVAPPAVVSDKLSDDGTRKFLIDVGNGRKPRVGALDGSVIATSLQHAISTAQITVPDIWDVRRTIEQRTAALAATARTDEEAAEIVALAEAMAADKDDLAKRTEHDIAFHNAIAAASHNNVRNGCFCVL